MRGMMLGSLALGALAAIPAAAQDLRSPLVDGTILDISAEGKSTRTPDLATIQAGVVIEAPTASAAMQQNAQRMRGVLAALKAAGIADRDMQTASISLSPQYRYQDGRPPVLTGYQASNQINVRFRDIEKSGAILDALVKEGANNISGPDLTVERADTALDEARADAVAKAKARAALYAKAAGLRVDRILLISEQSGQFQPIDERMRMAVPMAADAAANSVVVAGERELSVTLTVRFLLK